MRIGAQASRLAVGLTRVSTAEQGQSGLGLEAQQASIRSFVAAQGWILVAEYSDIASGKDDRRLGRVDNYLNHKIVAAMVTTARKFRAVFS